MSCHANETMPTDSAAQDPSAIEPVDTEISMPLTKKQSIKWTVNRCHKSTGEQKASDAEVLRHSHHRSGEVMVGLEVTDLTLSYCDCRPNDRTDVDMPVQRIRLRQLEQDQKFFRIMEHENNCRFDRSFAARALKLLVVEAARYQRTYFEPGNGNPTTALKVAHTLRPQGKPKRQSYMLLTAAQLLSLLDDIGWMLSPSQPVDRSENVLQQLQGLSLFTPSNFPLDAGQQH